jgi:acetylornithine deacetylase/succinyl-diaminopimelate desuccinylase-like protein
MVEGEEESGSPTFDQLLQSNAERLKADVVVVADCDNWDVGIPSLTTQLRGVTDVKVTLRTATHGSHSGMFGGPVLDAPLLLARLIATLHDANGDVAVDGLVRTGTSPVDYPEDRIRQPTGLLDSVQLAGTGPIADRLWNSPAISLIGFDAPRTDQVSNTLIEVASAVVSLRVPPGLDAIEAQAALHRHLVEHAPFGAQVEVQDGVSGPGFLADVEAPAAAAAAWALTQAFGHQVVYTGQGGSIPLAQQIKAVFPNIEVLLTGVEDPTSNAHAANESVDLGMLEKAILAEALFLAKLGGVLS